MRTVGLALLIGGVVGLTLAYAQSVQYKAAESYMPEVVTIRKELPDRARICVEPSGGGLLACRPIGDLRVWIQERKAR